MKRINKLIICLVFVLLCLLFPACKQADTNYSQKTTPDFKGVTSLLVDADNYDLTLKVSEKEVCYVEYEESTTHKIEVTEKDGKVTIKEIHKAWFNFLSYNPRPQITVYVCNKISADLELDNGKVTVENGLSFAHLKVDIDNGMASINGANVENQVKIDIDNGAINCSNMQTANYSANIDNGAIYVEKLVANSIKCEVDNGSIELVCIEASSLVDLSVDVGDIDANLKGEKENYKTTVNVDIGKANIYPSTSGSVILNLFVDVGDINVTFYN